VLIEKYHIYIYRERERERGGERERGREREGEREIHTGWTGSGLSSHDLGRP